MRIDALIFSPPPRSVALLQTISSPPPAPPHPLPHSSVPSPPIFRRLTTSTPPESILFLTTTTPDGELDKINALLFVSLKRTLKLRGGVRGKRRRHLRERRLVPARAGDALAVGRGRRAVLHPAPPLRPACSGTAFNQHPRLMHGRMYPHHITSHAYTYITYHVTSLVHVHIFHITSHHVFTFFYKVAAHTRSIDLHSPPPYLASDSRFFSSGVIFWRRSNDRLRSASRCSGVCAVRRFSPLAADDFGADFSEDGTSSSPSAGSACN